MTGSTGGVNNLGVLSRHQLILPRTGVHTVPSEAAGTSLFHAVVMASCLKAGSCASATHPQSSSCIKKNNMHYSQRCATGHSVHSENEVSFAISRTEAHLRHQGQ